MAPKGYTRRQLIERERKNEFFYVILIAFMLLVFFIFCIMSCARCAGCTAAEELPAEPMVTESDVQEEYDPSRLTAEDIDFLRSLTTYPRLVNHDNPLGANYVPPELTRLLGMPDGDTERLTFEAAMAFMDLYDAMLKEGIAVLPLSGYRTYQEQVSIYNYNIQLHTSEGMTPEEAREYTAKFVALPGTSEHQYGRSIDVTIDGTTNHSFHETDQGKWLIDHAHEYGFVVRYPADKVEITKINYEPWHLRYVGEEHAAFMHAHELCLEEYVELIRRYNAAAHPDE